MAAAEGEKNMKNREVFDRSPELFLSKDGKRKSVQKGKNMKQSSKRGKRVPEKARDPLGIPSENCDTETQPHMQDKFFEKRAVDRSQDWPVLSKDGKQKAVLKGKHKKQSTKRGKGVPAKPIHGPEIPLHEGNQGYSRAELEEFLKNKVNNEEYVLPKFISPVHLYKGVECFEDYDKIPRFKGCAHFIFNHERGKGGTFDRKIGHGETWRIIFGPNNDPGKTLDMPGDICTKRIFQRHNRSKTCIVDLEGRMEEYMLKSDENTIFVKKICKVSHPRWHIEVKEGNGNKEEKAYELPVVSPLLSCSAGGSIMQDDIELLKTNLDKWAKGEDKAISLRKRIFEICPPGVTKRKKILKKRV